MTKMMKSIIALSEGFDSRLAVQLNALGHLAQSIGHQTSRQPTGRFVSYVDARGDNLGSLSWWPLIVLAARPQKIVQLWSDLEVYDWPKACFVDTMVQGGSEAQLAATAVGKPDSLNIVAVAAFGPAEEINGLTKKLSLWRAPGGFAVASGSTLSP
jgi:hypothetical protein